MLANKKRKIDLLSSQIDKSFFFQNSHLEFY